MNRLVSNIYIVDSQQIHLPLPYATSGVTCTTANVGKMIVSGVIFQAVDTSARCKVALMSTTNVILDYGVVTAGTGTHEWERTTIYSFAHGVPMMGIMIPTITAATACFILE